MISDKAIIDKNSKLESAVAVGPFSIIGKEVKIGKNVKILSHVVISGDTSISDDCVIYSFASIGSTPQDLKFKGDIKNECLPVISRLHGGLLSFVDAGLFKKQEGYSKNIYFTGSQLMYTPVDDKTSTIIKDDRPYAGLLSLGIGINERNRDQIKNIQILNGKIL